MVRIKNEMNNTSANWITNNIRLFIETLIRIVDGDKTFYDTTHLKLAHEFEANYPVIKQELLDLFDKNIPIPDWQSISNDPNVRIGKAWNVFIFKVYESNIKQNCELCPKTAALIDKYPQITTAWFSILEPNNKISEHRGPYNGVLRYHLAVLIPENYLDCGIRVKDDIRHWEEGKSLLFDDTHLHEAWNNTNERRVVLFMDIIRKLTFPLNLINKIVIKVIKYSEFPQAVINNLKNEATTK